MCSNNNPIIINDCSFNQDTNESRECPDRIILSSIMDKGQSGSYF